MNEQELRELGVEDKAIISSILGYFRREQEKVELLEEELKEANEVLNEFKDIDVNEIQGKVEEYQAKYEEALKEKQEYVLKTELSKYNPHDVKDIMLYIDKEALEFEGGEIKNLEEQIKTLKEEKSYLFKSEGVKEVKEETPRFTAPANKNSATVTQEDFNSMGYSERLELKKKNENLYKKLINGGRG